MILHRLAAGERLRANLRPRRVDSDCPIEPIVDRNAEARSPSPP
jgi:hypothetical protein